MHDSLQLNQYLIRRKVFKIFGASFKIFDTQGNLRLFIKQKAFKLREDIRIYSDETMTDELLLIKAKKVIDFSSTYEVFDSKSNEKVGSLRRRGFKSILKDEWIVFDSLDQEIGRIKEDSGAMAFLRRFLTGLIPQTFFCFIGQSNVCTFKQKFNPFIYKMDLDFTNDPMNMFDRRIGISAGILLAAIEGRQN